MSEINARITFDSLSYYERMTTQDAHCSGKTVLWVKETSGERFLCATRITSIWDQFLRMGLVTTILSWFNCGNASIGACVQFLNQADLKSQFRNRYINPETLEETAQVDKAIASINKLATKHGLQTFSLDLSEEQKAELQTTIASKTAARAEEQRAADLIYQEQWQARQNAQIAAQAQRAQDESQHEREQIALQQPQHVHQAYNPSHIRTSVTVTGSSVRADVTQTINGTITHYTHTF